MSQKLKTNKSKTLEFERQNLKLSGERSFIISSTTERRPVCIICATPYERYDEYTILKKCAC